MAKDELPGLLSKVVKFVRNPTTDWANLSDVDAEREESFSKQQLKEMIERKRRNDFVRRREFDQLRKLRSREPHSVLDLAERPSFFQSSLTSRPVEDRAGTLKKIDEIEEQMSQQWWRTHKEAGHPPGGAPVADAAAAGGSGIAYALTEAAALDGVDAGPADAVLPAGDLALNHSTPTVPGALALGEPGVLGGIGLYDPMAGLDGPAFVHAPDLEEAAIRFANGDVKGAEQNLQELLAADSDVQHVWTALFDLYRATGQHPPFEDAALDYAVRFNRLAPLWASFPDMLDALVVGASGSPRDDKNEAGFRWTCPASLGAHAVTGLSARLTRAPQPWSFDWSALKTIEVSALDLLADQFERWSAEPVRLQFEGVDVLLAVLRDKTPAGDATVAPVWWRLRMEVLRTTGQAETFDLTALEYCVTYEVSPPSWVDVRCDYVPVGAGAEVPAYDSFVGVVASEFLPTSFMQDAPVASGVTQIPPLPTAELAGQITGDASGALGALESCAQGGVLVVACDKLARVDFSAAGSILNWVAARQAEGCQVVFCNLHSLLAVFFGVIGINEHAKVLPRK